MVLSVQQRVFVVESYVKSGSFKICREEFQQKYGTDSPCKSAIHKLLKKWRQTGSVRDVKRARQNRVRTPDNIEDVGNRMLQSPSKSIRRLSQQTGISRTTCQVILKKDLKLTPYKISVVHQLKPADAPARIAYCNWFQNEVESGLLDPGLYFITDEAWFHLSGYVNSQNNRYWSSDNPHEFQEQPLHDQKIGVWCAISSRRIVGPIFFEQTVNSNRYIVNILNPFLEQLTDEEKSFGYFQQDGATAHTARVTIERVHAVFGAERTVSRNSDTAWPARSPDLSPCDFFLWGSLKGQVYQNKPRTLEELKTNISNAISAIPEQQLQRVSENMFTRVQRCLDAGGGHFQHLL